jgi:hypothetical protein
MTELRRHANRPPGAPQDGSQSSSAPSLDVTRFEPTGQVGSDPSAHDAGPPASAIGRLPSSQVGSPAPVGPDEPIVQRSVEPSSESNADEPSSHVALEPSAQATEPSAACTGALPSSQAGSPGAAISFVAGAPQTKPEPSLEKVGSEPGQVGVDPSLQE